MDGEERRYRQTQLKQRKENLDNTLRIEERFSVMRRISELSQPRAAAPNSNKKRPFEFELVGEGHNLQGISLTLMTFETPVLLTLK